MITLEEEEEGRMKEEEGRKKKLDSVSERVNLVSLSQEKRGGKNWREKGLVRGREKMKK